LPRGVNREGGSQALDKARYFKRDEGIVDTYQQPELVIR